MPIARKQERSSTLAFRPPCLPMAASEPPLGSDWLHEIKFDGYRVQALVDRGGVRLMTRNGLDWSNRFGRAVVDAFARLDVRSAAIDCEAVVRIESGASDFGALQAELKKGRTARVEMMAFDLVDLDGHAIANSPLVERKAALERVVGTLPRQSPVRYSSGIVGDGRAIFESACALGLEGIVSKRVDRPYVSGRTQNWIKAKCVAQAAFVVVGYVLSKSAGAVVGSLLLGFFERDQLVYAGRVGSGFTTAEAHAMAAGLSTIKSARPVLSVEPRQREGVEWVEPRVVVQISYRSITPDGLLRHATFSHVRDDKRPEDVGRPFDFDLRRGMNEMRE